jgi:hypothetical protein
MTITLLAILISALLLIAAAAVIFLWDKAKGSGIAPSEGSGKPEGAFRPFYHVLWSLILWSGLALSLPLWVSYKQHLAGLDLGERGITVGKLLVFPLILLLILRYGSRLGYLKWIDGLQWPDRENE